MRARNDPRVMINLYTSLTERDIPGAAKAPIIPYKHKPRAKCGGRAESDWRNDSRIYVDVNTR